MDEVGIWLRRARLRLGSGALFFGSFAFGELAVDGADLLSVLYILLGSLGRTKEMNR